VNPRPVILKIRVNPRSVILEIRVNPRSVILKIRVNPRSVILKIRVNPRPVILKIRVNPRPVIKPPPPFFCLTHPRHITILSALGPNAPAERLDFRGTGPGMPFWSGL
jgi:hypothetical protein